MSNETFLKGILFIGVIVVPGFYVYQMYNSKVACDEAMLAYSKTFGYSSSPAEKKAAEASAQSACNVLELQAKAVLPRTSNR